MPHIHPTSIVDAKAELADDVVIGPYCVIKGDVRLGAGCQLVSHCFLKGPLVMGERNTVYPFATLGSEPQDRRMGLDYVGPGTLIGNDNVFRENVTIHRGGKTRATTIGDRNYFMAYSHAAHDCLIGNDCNFANSSALAGHCEVGDRVILGGGAGAQQFCRLGRMSFLAGNEGITKDLPPFCMVHHSKAVASLNLVGLRRSGYQKNIDNVRKAFRVLYRSGLTNAAAVTRIRTELAHDPLCLEMADFVAGTKQGITTYANSRTFRVRGTSSTGSAGDDMGG